MRLRNFLNLCKQYLLHPRQTYRDRCEIRLERLVDSTVKDMVIMGISAHTTRLIALAERYIKDPYEHSPAGLRGAARHWARSEVGRLAAAKKLAMESRWDLSLAEVYAWTGYQREIEDNPLMRNLLETHRGGPITAEAVNPVAITEFIQEAKINELKRISPDFLVQLLPESELSESDPAFVAHLRRLLADRKDLLSGGRNQMTGERKELLDRIVEARAEDRKNRRLAAA